MTELNDLVSMLRSYKSELEWFEFKVNWYDPNQIGEYISAISNSAACAGRKEGYLIWGINNETHEIENSDFDPNVDVHREPLKHYLARQLTPYVDFEFEETIIESKHVVVLKIPAANVVPTAFRNERYIRIGSSKENLRKFPEKESYLFDVMRHGFPTIENTASEYQDLTFEKLFIYYGAKGLTLNLDTFKKNLELLTADGKYNILAQLLSDNSHIPIRVAIFSDKTKADNLYSVREFGNQCLLYSLDEVLRYGDVLNIIQADESDRIVERKEVPLFENNAFREAVINAFVHNAWITKNEPMLTVYSDRIEVLSRGTLAPGQTINGFFAGESIPVNRKLSEIFLQLHISEKTGRGVPVITQVYGKDAYDFRENSIVVTIPFKWINIMGDKRGDKQGDKSINTNLNGTQQRILTEIRNNPNITKPQLCAVLSVGKTTVDNGIATLRRKGYIERIGSNKTGYWKVRESHGHG